MKDSVIRVFEQLSDAINILPKGEYIQPRKVLFNATIGKHFRHIIELFLCLEAGYQSGIVNYEKRKRDHAIETNKEFAIELLLKTGNRIEKPNRTLILETHLDEHSSLQFDISTNYYRELLYNLEHTVHHMALIRIGIEEVSGILLPENFGVAFSTVKYQKARMQLDSETTQ